MRNSFVFGFCLRSTAAIVLCSLGISKAMAQEEGRKYVPFVEEGKTWYCTHSYIGRITPEHPEGEGIDCIFTMHGDTLINGQKYKKVYCQYEHYYGEKEQHYYCAVREEAYKVFIIEYETTEEKLIYDFSRTEEVISLTYNDYSFARSDGWHRPGFLPGQLEYVVCRYSGGEVDYSNGPTFWYDGLGAVHYNPFSFELWPLLFIEPILGKHMVVRTCMKDGKYIFNIEWMVDNGSAAIVGSCYTDSSQKQSHLIDLQGRRLTLQPRPGIYIRDGRKVVVK